MKNPRSLTEHAQLIKKHNLSTSSPAPDSLFWKMWNAGGDKIAQKALETDFLKGIKNGNLSPSTYGAFNVSDIYYCFNGASDYGTAAKRATHEVLKDYLHTKQQSYNKYNTSACEAWNLTGPESVAPTSTALKYSAFERSVAQGHVNNTNAIDPIYTLIVMIPCEFLWAWLAEQLIAYDQGNLYANWITSNASFEGAYAMGNFLHDYIANTPIDENLATSIYLTAMEFEYRNFASAS